MPNIHKFGRYNLNFVLIFTVKVRKYPYNDCLSFTYQLICFGLHVSLTLRILFSILLLNTHVNLVSGTHPEVKDKELKLGALSLLAED